MSPYHRSIRNPNRKPFLNVLHLCAAAAVLALGACAAEPPSAVTADDICDVVTPPTGSRVVHKVRCEPTKPAVKPAG